MKVLITGASGFIGSALSRHLASLGHQPVPVRRGRTSGPWWDPENDAVDLTPAAPFDALVHLAGEHVASRWTAAKKRRLYDSRVLGTRLIIKGLRLLSAPPKTLICASGVGFYGNQGDEWVDETSLRGRGFLADLCRDWEAAALESKLSRVVLLRIGMVLGRKGGALAKMLPVFRLGLGGRLGSGMQYHSWISIQDTVAAITWLLEEAEISGPVNMASPEPVTNSVFTKTLGKVLRRPAFFHVPATALGLIFKREMADETFLSSTRVRPLRLHLAGFKFRHNTLESALQAALRD